MTKRIEVNKKVLYRLAIIIKNNELLINKDPRIRTYSHDLAGKNSPDYCCYARDKALGKELCKQQWLYV